MWKYIIFYDYANIFFKLFCLEMGRVSGGSREVPGPLFKKTENIWSNQAPPGQI